MKRICLNKDQGGDYLGCNAFPAILIPLLLWASRNTEGRYRVLSTGPEETEGPEVRDGIPEPLPSHALEISCSSYPAAGRLVETSVFLTEGGFHCQRQRREEGVPEAC